jgi:Fe-S cluster assembly protein SufD
MTATLESVQSAVEMDQVESHLHPVPSYDLTDHPVPTGREEVWRFTPLRRMRNLLDGRASEAHLDWETSLPEGAILREISSADARLMGEVTPGDRPSALAVANAGGAMLLEIAADVELDKPVLIKLSGTGGLVYGHLVIKVGAHASATIVLEHAGSAKYLAQTSILVGDGAQVRVVTLQDWAEDAHHLGRDAIRVGRDAHVRHVGITFGGDVVRLNTDVTYDGPGGSAELFGLYFADAGQHLEHRLFVDHNAPRTKSNVVYKGALQGHKAHTVWVGNVLIRKIAEGIETYEENRNLVLTDGCQADSVPNLEIETGEIEGAGHASATGRFDDNQLFYLRSRGIEEAEARRLVVHGFFHDLIRKIDVPQLEARLLEVVESELERHVLKGVNA